MIPFQYYPWSTIELVNARRFKNSYPPYQLSRVCLVGAHKLALIAELQSKKHDLPLYSGCRSTHSMSHTWNINELGKK
jgi:hypothetical protein